MWKLRNSDNSIIYGLEFCHLIKEHVLLLMGLYNTKIQLDSSFFSSSLLENQLSLMKIEHAREIQKKERLEQKDPSEQRTKTIKLHNYKKQWLQ